jgi:hypothetical protein
MQIYEQELDNFLTRLQEVAEVIAILAERS